MNTDIAAEAPESARVARQEQRVHPPLKPLHVSLLVFFTLGLYSCFFYYLHARDARRLGDGITLPWLWLFVPALAITLPFATKSLFVRYQNLARDQGLKLRNRGAPLGWLAFGLFFLESAYSRAVPLYGDLVLMVVFLAYSMVFFLLTRDINVFKAALPREKLTGPPRKLMRSHWVTLILGGMVAVPFYGFTIYSDVTQLMRPTLPVAERWHHPTQPFSIETPDRWSIAGVGSFSDGSAAAEFTRSEREYVIVFDHTLGDTANDVSAFRREMARSDDAQASCTERRELRPGTLVSVSELHCEGSFLGDPLVSISTFIDDGEKQFELLAVSEVIARHKPASVARLKRFAAGFLIEYE